MKKYFFPIYDIYNLNNVLYINFIDYNKVAIEKTQIILKDIHNFLPPSLNLPFVICLPLFININLWSLWYFMFHMNSDFVPLL